jgi:hypothetical protein
MQSFHIRVYQYEGVRKMKRFLAGLMVAAVALCTSVAAKPVGAAVSPRILLDGLPLAFPVAPRVEADRTLVPFRAIAEALGVTVTWYQSTRSIDAQGLNHQVRLQIDSAVMSVDGIPVALDVPPRMVDDRTLVPLRAFSAAFGARVDWDGATQTAMLISPVRPMRTLAFYALRSYPERQLVARFSDAAYGWAMLKSDGHVDLAGGEYRWPEPDGDVTGERLLADAAGARVRRLLSIHAVDRQTADLAALVRRPELVATAASDIVAVVKSRGFDGVVLDLEGLGQNEQGDDLQRTRQGFNSLVASVSKELRAAGKETIVSVHPLNGWYHGYDYAALAGAADLLQVMAHDFTASGGPEPSDQVEEAIRLAVAAVGPERRTKLLLGIVAPYETAETLPQKAGLAKRYGLAGVSLWRLGEVGSERMAALDATITPQR